MDSVRPVMSVVDFAFRNILLKKRKPELARLKNLRACAEIQEETLLSSVRFAQETVFGIDHCFSEIHSVRDYQRLVPLRTYEDFFKDYFFPASQAKSRELRIAYQPDTTSPFLDNVTWPGFISAFSLSSGTTSGKTKFIPLTQELMQGNRKAALDILMLRYLNEPKKQWLGGKIFFLGGSPALRRDWNGRVKGGDLSGIAVDQMPWYLELLYFPGRSIASIPDWEQKMELAAEAALRQNIAVLSGVPTWALLFLQALERKRKFKGDIRKIWPAFQLCIHGGVSFGPYREQFQSWLGPDCSFQEVYPASEGFIAIEDPHEHALRLMPDYGIFYEFVPLEELSSSVPKRFLLSEVEIGQNYAIVLTTNGGLWSYVLGDTVRFVSKEPPLLKITGRTKYYLSAFGEHVIQEEIENALLQACKVCNASFSDYHVAPVFPDSKNPVGHHQFLIELAGLPANAKKFSEIYDATLQKLNEDYAAHRSAGFGMGEPEFVFVPSGFFTRWMKEKGKIGGQHKVPRISGNRDTMSEMVHFLSQSR